jgi:hypothetical protein
MLSKIKKYDYYNKPHRDSNEISLIHSLFKEGMALLILGNLIFRGRDEHFVTEIRLEYRNRLVLHSPYHLAKALVILHSFY